MGSGGMRGEAATRTYNKVENLEVLKENESLLLTQRNKQNTDIKKAVTNRVKLNRYYD